MVDRYDITAYVIREFPLSMLPFVAMREVAQFLTIPERIKLALTSKKMKRSLSYSKIPMAECEIRIRDEYSHIYFKRQHFKIYCGQRFLRTTDFDILKKRDLKPWRIRNGTIIENIIEILRNVSETVNLTSITLCLIMNEMELMSVRQVLSVPELNIWNVIIVQEENPSFDDLDAIMERADEGRTVKIQRSMPTCYEHENVFKFNNVVYVDAAWVRLDNLLTLKNKERLYLSETWFDLSDIKKVIERWIDNDYDMFTMLAFIQYFPPFTDILRSALTDFVVMESWRKKSVYFLICANPTKVHRKLNVLCVQKRTKSITLDAITPFKPIEQNFDPFTKEFKVLTIVNEMKQMEDELKSIDSLLSTDIQENEKKKLIEKREELKGQVETMKNRIEEEEVRFENGLWKMNQN